MDNEKKIKSRELMRSMFVDLNSSIDRKDYLNNKSNEIIRKKEELGYKSGRLDLRSFENFYNEVSKKTQVEVEQLYELFLNFINSTSVELVEEKIVFFEKMLYIFFSKTDEQLNFWKFYQKKFEEKNIVETLKKLNLDRIEYQSENKNEEKTQSLNIDNNNKDEMSIFLDKIEKINETSILKAELLIFEKIQELDKEITELEKDKEYDLLYENTNEITLIDEQIKTVEEKKEFFYKKLREYEEILKSNFYEKESVFLFIESILLGIGNVFDKKQDNKEKISVGNDDSTNYESLLKLFKEILNYTEFDVKNLNDKEFMEFLQRNKVKLVEIFAIVLTNILEELKKKKNKVILSDLLLINNYRDYDKALFNETENIEENLKKGALQNSGINKEELINRINNEYKDIYVDFLEEITLFLEKLDIFIQKYNKVLKYKVKKMATDVLKIGINDNKINGMAVAETLVNYRNLKKKIFFKESEILEFEKVARELIEYDILKEERNEETGQVNYSFQTEKVINFNELLFKEEEIRKDKDDTIKEISEEERKNLLEESDIMDFLLEKSKFFKRFRENILVRYIKLNIIFSNYINKNIFYFSKDIIKSIRTKIKDELMNLKKVFSLLEEIKLEYVFDIIDVDTIKLKNETDINSLIEKIKKEINDIISNLKTNKEVRNNDKNITKIKLCDYINKNLEKNVSDFVKYLKKCEIENEKSKSRPVEFFLNNCNEILKSSVDSFKNNAGITKKINFIKNNNINVKLIIKDDEIINEIKAISSIKKILFNSQLQIIVDKFYENNEYEFNSDKEFASFVLNTILFNKADINMYDENNIDIIKKLGINSLKDDDEKVIKNSYNEELDLDDLKIILHYLKR
jgi:hypothetical protein